MLETPQGASHKQTWDAAGIPVAPPGAGVSPRWKEAALEVLKPRSFQPNSSLDPHRCNPSVLPSPCAGSGCAPGSFLDELPAEVAQHSWSSAACAGSTPRARFPSNSQQEAPGSSSLQGEWDVGAGRCWNGAAGLSHPPGLAALSREELLPPGELGFGFSREGRWEVLAGTGAAALSPTSLPASTAFCDPKQSQTLPCPVEKEETTFNDVI